MTEDRQDKQQARVSVHADGRTNAVECVRFWVRMWATYTNTPGDSIRSLIGKLKHKVFDTTFI